MGISSCPTWVFTCHEEYTTPLFMEKCLTWRLNSLIMKTAAENNLYLFYRELWSSNILRNVPSTFPVWCAQNPGKPATSRWTQLWWFWSQGASVVYYWLDRRRCCTQSGISTIYTFDERCVWCTISLAQPTPDRCWGWDSVYHDSLFWRGYCKQCDTRTFEMAFV